MKRETQGKYVITSTVGESVKAFIPSPLPPIPNIEWSPELRDKFDKAHLALGRLDSVSTLLPDTSLFLYMYMRKEAVLSSQIEGTQSSLFDLLFFEMDQNTEVPLDVREVSNYTESLNHGLERLAEGFPLSLRLLKEIHAILLSEGRGGNQSPGEFRHSQNWIGGTRPGNAVFVPPPPQDVMECMGSLELFLHDNKSKTPVLLKIALIHVQFETIHPFLDGNGRLGRLLITLMLCAEKVMLEPMLYLSLYFKSHRDRYYELLNNVRSTGDWESWLDFFADAVIETANQAVDTAKLLVKLSSSDRAKIAALGKKSGSALRVHLALTEQPIASSKWLAEKSQLSPATVNKCLEHLEKLEIVYKADKKKRNRLFIYGAYISILNRGTDAPFKS